MLKSGQTWAGIFATYDSDGSLKAPSSGPTGTLYVDGSSNSATVTITGSNPYKFSVTLPTLTAGQRVDMYITATISGIATAGIVASDQADTAYISNVKSDTADILADTGTDGVLLSVGTGSKQIDLSSGKVLLQPTQTGVTIPTVTNLTNLPTMPTDWVTAAGVKADAVTKIQSGLATAAALTVVSGYVDELETRLTAARAGYLDKLNVSGTLANTDNANSFKADVSNLALEATLSAIKGSGWTNETLKAIKEYVDDLESRLTAVRAGYLDNLTKLDANISSRLAASGYTAPDNANILNIKAKTDNLPATPADEATLTAMKGTGWTGIETLKAIKDYVDELETRLTAARAGYLDKLNVSGDLANTNNADAFKADVSGIPAAVWGYATRTLSSFGTLISDIWSHATRTLSAFGFTVATQSDANVTAIKAKTDNLPAIPAPANEYDAELAAIQADLDNPNQYKADVSGLATTTHLQEVEDKVDTADTVVDAIKAKTDNLPANPAPAGEYDTRLTAIQTDLDNPDQYKADVSGIPAAVWGYATRTLSSFGTLISDIWAHATRTLSAFGFTVATQSDANVTAIKAKTDNLPASPAATGDAMTLTAAYDHAKDDVLTPLGVVDGVVDAIKLKTDNIPATPANEATLTAIKGAGWTDETLVALMTAIENISAGSGASAQEVWEYATRTLSAFGFTVATQSDANVTAIKAKTDNLPATPANEATLTAISALVDDLESRLTAVRAGYLDKLNVTGTLANTDNASLFSDDLLNSIIEDTISLKESLRLMLAVLAGRSDGGGTGTIKFKDLGGTFDRITATVDVVGNRTNVVLDGSDTGV